MGRRLGQDRKALSKEMSKLLAAGLKILGLKPHLQKYCMDDA